MIKKSNNIPAGPRFSHEQWQGIFNTIPDAIVITDQQFNILSVNRAFSALSGLAASELVGRKCHELFPCALCHTPGCPLAKVRSARKQIVFEDEAHCKNGQQAPLIITATAFEDDDGNVGGYVERITDAGAFRQVKQALSRSHERLRKNMGAIIQAMSTTIEKRDPYTAGHQRRVAKLCRAIATQMDFSWDHIQGLRMTAAIHDLGKIQVPSGILNKPGAISKHEMAIIKMHPRTAYDILKGIQFPWPVAETIYQHHERLDGSGYPRKLKGDQILLEARILAVADVVESMASFRPYRPELGIEAALEEIQKYKGILYDASVVDVCTALITRQGFDFKSKLWQRHSRKKAPDQTDNRLSGSEEAHGAQKSDSS
ncbi:MAG: HD domain-containing phosphohydrolase [Desulfobacteraceae bacterium]|jgi:PAS domain S-box-containing protein